MQSLVSIGDLFKKSFEAYKQHLNIILGVALVGYAPVLLLYLSGENESFSPVFWVFSLLIAALNLLAYIAFLYIAKEMKEGAVQESYGAKLKRLFAMAFSNIIPVIWVSVLTFAVVLAGLVLLIVPGIIFMVWFGFSLFVLVFEGQRGTQALTASRQLVKGYWWPVFWRFLVFGIISTIISMVPFFGDLVNAFVMTPLCVMYGYFMYQDLKRIKGTVSV